MPMEKDKEIEEWKEKFHQLNLKLNSVQQTHRNEVEYLKEELGVKENELKTVEETLKTEFKLREKKWTEQVSCRYHRLTCLILIPNANAMSFQGQLISFQINDLQEYLQESRDEGAFLKGQVEQQQRSIEQLKSLHSDRQIRNELSESQKIREDQLSQELKSSRTLLETQQSKLHHFMQLTDQQKESIAELTEEIDSKDVCIGQLQSRMREIEAERAEEEALAQALQAHNHISEEEASDPNKRGNSLFSELEERRVRVEEELIRLRARVTRLTVENVDLKASLERGDCRSAIIVTQLQTISKSDADLVQSLKQLKCESQDLFEHYEDRLRALTTEYNRKLLQLRSGLDPDAPQPSELESVRAERDRLLGLQISQNRELFELRKELKHAEHHRTSAEANIKILRVKLQALQDQFSKATGTYLSI